METIKFSSRRVISHSLEELKALFEYDPESGEIKRIQEVGRKRENKGKPNKAGYLIVSIGGKIYYYHLVAWMLGHGKVPPNELVIDHKNRDKTDNRLANLRLRTQRLNCLNAEQQKNTQTGYRGVYPSGKKFMAKIRDMNKLLHLGSFDTAELASAAYEQAHQSLVLKLEKELEEKLKETQ